MTTIKDGVVSRINSSSLQPFELPVLEPTQDILAYLNYHQIHQLVGVTSKINDSPNQQESNHHHGLPSPRRGVCMVSNFITVAQMNSPPDAPKLFAQRTWRRNAKGNGNKRSDGVLSNAVS
jgi:hypothetical protein